MLLLYTIQPAFLYAFDLFDPADPILSIGINSNEFYAHLWRHFIYIFGFSVAYLFFRGDASLPRNINLGSFKAIQKPIFVLFVVLFVGLYYLNTVSLEVDNYYDNYVRYDHLGWFGKKITSLIVRFKLGIYTIILVSLMTYRGNKLFLGLLFLSTACAYELVYSFGSRIQVLILIIQFILLYHFTRHGIPLTKVFILGIIALLSFSLIEFVRLSSSGSFIDFNDLNLNFPMELNSVFFSGAHLYKQLSAGSLPSAPWPMYFYEITSILLPGDYVEWNPMEWYRLNFHPDSVFPPMTLGPIADSAIWGGELDLFVHALFNGLFFAFIVKSFIRFQDKLWMVVFYLFACGSCILTIKYSVLYLLNPIVKNILPALILYYLIRLFFSSRKISI